MSSIFSERENATILTPGLKMRQRLPSAQGNILKTPLTGIKLKAPLPSGRKALGAVNKICFAPAVNGKEKSKIIERKDTKVRTLTSIKVEEYPDIENFIPYDPLEFENYIFPEDVVRLSHLALPGMGFLPQMHHLPEEDFAVLEEYQPMSPLKNTHRSDFCSTEFDAFLQTINDVTIDMPPVTE
ncbi:hypothetical protein UPYG_G00207820 [Umbra pygmaea]|uniref:Securin n=1 Tax=Umbra pygmaea TaxID=75934 RepID=A0ABD0X9W5_UMBPY